MVLCSTKRKKISIRRRVLPCLLFLCTLLQARSLTDELGSFFFSEQQHYGAESSYVSLSSAYDLPLYFRREDPIGDSLLGIDLNYVTNHIDAAYSREAWGSRIRISHRYKSFELENRVEGDLFQVSSASNQLHARGDLWLNYGDAGNQLGISVGRFIVGDSISLPHMKVSPEFPFTGFMDNDKNSYAFWCNLKKGIFSSTLLFDKTVSCFEPLHMSKSSGSYKNLPLMQFQRRVHAQGAIEKMGRRLSLRWERRKIYSERVVLTNCLPFLSDWLQYKVGVDAQYRDHTLGLEAFTALGSFYGYEDEAPDAPRYLIHDDIFMKEIEGHYGYTLSPRLTLGCQGELFKGDSPEKGTIELYPFSSWSIFKPVKFRFTESELNYRKAGLTTKVTLGRKHETKLGFDLDFHRAELTTKREKRKIIVLVPIYVDKTTFSPIHHYLLTGDLTLLQRFSLGKVALDLKLQQILPLFSKEFDTTSAEDDSGDSGDTDDAESPTFDVKFFGGFKASISLTIPL